MSAQEKRKFRQGLDTSKTAIKRRQLNQNLKKNAREEKNSQRRGIVNSATQANTNHNEIVHGIISNNQQPMEKLHRLLQDDAEFPLKVFVDQNVIPLFVTCLSKVSNENTTSRQHVCRCIALIASSGATEIVFPCVSGLVQLFVNDNTSDQEVREIAWALGTIANQDEKFQLQLLKMDLLSCILKKLSANVTAKRDQSLQSSQYMYWCMSQLVYASGATKLNAEKDALIGTQMETLLASLAAYTTWIAASQTEKPVLLTSAIELLIEMAWLMCDLVSLSNSHTLFCIDKQLLQMVVQLVQKHLPFLLEYERNKQSRATPSLMSSPLSAPMLLDAPLCRSSARTSLLDALYIPLVRCLGFMCSAHAADPTKSDLMVLPVAQVPYQVILTCLGSCHRQLKKETICLIANIAAASYDHARVLCVGPFAELLKVLQHLMVNERFDVQREILYALYNMAVHKDLIAAVVTPQQQETAIIDVITGVFSLMGCCDIDVEIVIVKLIDLILHEVENGVQLLEERNVIEVLENTQTHGDDDLYRYAISLVDEFWGEENYVNDVNEQPDNGGWPTINTSSSSSDANASNSKPNAAAEFAFINPERMGNFKF